MVKKLMTGGDSVAYAMKQINPEVVSAYPITPQTPIIESFSKYVSDGAVNTNLIDVESEHSAMSLCIGASAAGARVMTASSSQGLAYMFEVIYTAAGLRLPIIMNVGNRALSAPINIHCDHSDTFPLRESGWLQIYNENVQEVYDTNFIALKIAETVNLPVMIMQDGFYTTHSLQEFVPATDSVVKKFIGNAPKRDTLFNKTITMGAFALQDCYYETRVQLYNAMESARKIIPEIQNEFENVFGRHYELFENYYADDAEFVVVVVNSTAGLIRLAVDKLRKQKIKIGMLKIRYFRPFPYSEIANVLKGKNVLVLDRNTSFGTEYSPLAEEVKSCTNSKIYNVVFGLGGRDFYLEDADILLNDFVNNKLNKFSFYGLRKDLEF